MTAADRAARTDAADRRCREAYEGAGGPEEGMALVAVGGYGRGELAPYSDLDVVLVHEDVVDPGRVASDVWYPLWDSGTALDHSVRSVSEMLEAAGADLKVALGLLDLRHVAGDPHLTVRLRTELLAAWRRGARERLPALRRLVVSRHELMGELAHLSVPDLKESEGGLRDAGVLRALGATWLVDVPHADLERCRRTMLDVRDLAQEAAGRASDRVVPETWAAVATGLGLADDRAAQHHVRELGRRVTHLSRLTWRRVEDVLTRPTSTRRARRPDLHPIAPGLALARGEVVLAAGARPEDDPVLLLRAAAEAAERDVVLAPPTAARLAREGAALPDPWPAEARQALVRLLAAGRGMLGVWETLEETGALAQVLPEWERIRLLPHASTVHRFTVDRHVVETCVEAAGLIRFVSRPDVLVVAALLHDIGKGGLTEHSVAGEPIARAVAARMGFSPDAVDLVARLVRWHLLLAETATTRDPDDPATVALVTDRMGDAESLQLLRALTEADAKATSTKAWSSWRAGLIQDLARRGLAALDAGTALPAITTDEVAVPEEATRGELVVQKTVVTDGCRLTTVARDRVGLLADLAAALALQRVPVRAARIWSQGEYGVCVWEVGDEHLDPAVLRERYEAVVDGRIDPVARLRPDQGSALEPAVVVRPEASEHATVLEVRAADRPGVVWLVCRALAALDVTVRSAHLDTLGPQAVDVFYLQEESAGVLSETRAAEAAHAVRAALTRPG
ncbi:Bifunctional uridylyltransferase/uridylyl-removing enzyme [Nocardioides aquaticus]|uniref:Bifunctional uridylyltransferase/uridylyl-removing enzyme n=1 Tax=Nocardioides aquaticus TaxID=160826 RepID=A0ABX8EHA4_9ACTN|nr:[protein-PII] uridylyltransferase [Nocardioides aquaticus]QVT78991.1 Bifunctional uridylyltransferase/uridylyl-removing enzyme [Nocardioides aquaticus]